MASGELPVLVDGVYEFDDSPGRSGSYERRVTSTATWLSEGGVA